jgi:uncharacterized membrane protein YkoI
MVRTLSRALVLVASLLATTAALYPAGALAQGCLSAGDIRAAVAKGEVTPLSGIISQIEAATGGQVQSFPQLCNVGGRLIYIVNVLTGGKLQRVQVDARSGSIMGY